MLRLFTHGQKSTGNYTTGKMRELKTKQTAQRLSLISGFRIRAKRLNCTEIYNNIYTVFTAL